MSETANCDQDFSTIIETTKINALVVKFNGQVIQPLAPVDLGNNEWRVTVNGSSIPEEGVLTYEIDGTVVKTVTVNCP